jgi:hypothetical protein
VWLQDTNKKIPLPREIRSVRQLELVGTWCNYQSCLPTIIFVRISLKDNTRILLMDVYSCLVLAGACNNSTYSSGSRLPVSERIFTVLQRLIRHSAVCPTSPIAISVLQSGFQQRFHPVSVEIWRNVWLCCFLTSKRLCFTQDYEWNKRPEGCRMQGLWWSPV